MADQESMTCAEKFNHYKRMIPTTGKILAIIILILNIVFPGSGTAVMACINCEFFKENIIIALLQFVLAFCVIGWIWSIVWGIFVIIKIDGDGMEIGGQNENPTPAQE